MCGQLATTLTLNTGLLPVLTRACYQQAYCWSSELQELDQRMLLQLPVILFLGYTLFDALLELTVQGMVTLVNDSSYIP